MKLLARADPAFQESLQSEVEPDPMEGEQTWPTDEELKQAEGVTPRHSITVQPLVWHVSNPKSPVGIQILVSCTKRGLHHYITGHLRGFVMKRISK